MRGLGSHSCGPEPEEKYEFRPHKFAFTFALSPCDFNQAVSISQTNLGKKTAALSPTYKYIMPKKITELADCDI